MTTDFSKYKKKLAARLHKIQNCKTNSNRQQAAQNG
jgi:hypothetical protein